MLVLDAAAWHLKTSRNLTQFETQMRRLREALAKRAPPGLLLFWVSPPPQSTLESAPRVDVPREWAPIYSRMAEDVGLLYPVGPAHHLDLLHLALGATTNRAAARQQPCFAWPEGLLAAQPDRSIFLSPPRQTACRGASAPTMACTPTKSCWSSRSSCLPMCWLWQRARHSRLRRRGGGGSKPCSLFNDTDQAASTSDCHLMFYLVRAGLQPHWDSERWRSRRCMLRTLPAMRSFVVALRPRVALRSVERRNGVSLVELGRC